ncbi:hypothetical protein PVK06_005532 [Gossypium arboreum]|uniref:Uncharacterized protein n=1 Tax=Gossypium arboreum TaxID=29729 RepID=A0ABR0QUV3_GOSAR|nr:hypothetical protein PVK06_005532 [Gossypium arboreum]
MSAIQKHELHKKPYHNRIITLLRDFHPSILQPILEPIPSWPRSHRCSLNNGGIYDGGDLSQHDKSGEIEER